MSDPLKLKRWTAKPPLGYPIDWTKPITRGLLAYWPINERRGGKLVDLVSSIELSAIGSPIWEGEGLKFATNDYGMAATTPTSLRINPPVTFILDAILHAKGVDYGNLFGVNNNNYEGDPYSSYVIGIAETTWWRLMYNNAGTFAQIGFNPDPAVTYGNRYLITCIIQNGDQRVYFNTSLVGQATNAISSIAYHATSNVGFGDILPSSRGSNMTALRGYIFNREVTTQEMYSLYTNPYQFIKTPLQDYFHIISAGAVDLVVADLTQAHTLENVVLTQLNILDPATLTNGQTLETFALTQKNILAVADLASAHTLDGITLTQKNILAAADLSTGQTIGNIELLQKHTISLADLTTEQTLANVDLTAIGDLVVQGLTTGQTLDATTLTQLHNIVVNDLANAQTLANIDLSSGIGLTVDNLTSAHSIDGNLALTQLNILTMQNLTTGQTIQAVVVSTGIYYKLFYIMKL